MTPTSPDHEPASNPIINAVPTGGLTLNFSLNREKTNQINGREIPDQGLNLADGELEPSPPTGGTISTFENVR